MHAMQLDKRARVVGWTLLFSIAGIGCDDVTAEFKASTLPGTSHITAVHTVANATGGATLEISGDTEEAVTPPSADSAGSLPSGVLAAFVSRESHKLDTTRSRFYGVDDSDSLLSVLQGTTKSDFVILSSQGDVSGVVKSAAMLTELMALGGMPSLKLMGSSDAMVFVGFRDAGAGNGVVKVASASADGRTMLVDDALIGTSTVQHDVCLTDGTACPELNANAVPLASDGGIVVDADNKLSVSTGKVLDIVSSSMTSGYGLSFASDTMSIDSLYTQRRVSGSCSAGATISTIAEDGTVTCVTPSAALALTTATTAAAVLTTNALLRGDGGARGVKTSGITVDASNNVSGVGTLTAGAISGTSLNVSGSGTAATNEIKAGAITTTSLNLPSVAAGAFFAGPTSGSNAAPAFRTLTAPTVQKFSSGSGTYNRPAGVLWIRVVMVGGGGGGGGGAETSGSNNCVAGGSGGNTTFGPQLMAYAGSGGACANNGSTGGNGGAATLGTGPIGVALTGSHGQPSGWSNVLSSGSMHLVGGGGGASPYFGGGSGGGAVGGTLSPAANSGSGGSGAYATANTSLQAFPGSGGGSGGVVDAIIIAPDATYTYSVGTGGAVGTAVSRNGTAGAAGQIIVWEYYQ